MLSDFRECTSIRRRERSTQLYAPSYLEQYNLSLARQKVIAQDEVPDWLSKTVVTLQPDHPLRALIPAQCEHIPRLNDIGLHEEPDRPPVCHIQMLPSALDPGEEVFAFRPPSALEDAMHVKQNSAQAIFRPIASVLSESKSPSSLSDHALSLHGFSASPMSRQPNRHGSSVMRRATMCRSAFAGSARWAGSSILWSGPAPTR